MTSMMFITMTMSASVSISVTMAGAIAAVSRFVLAVVPMSFARMMTMTVPVGSTVVFVSAGRARFLGSVTCHSTLKKCSDQQ